MQILSNKHITAREFIDRLSKAIPEEERDRELFICVHRDEDPDAMQGYARVPSGKYSDDFRIYLDVMTDNGLLGIDVFIQETPF